MGKIVLLAVAAAWAAVLLPPLLRSRMENRPGSSVTDFRRQLSTLQRAVPTRSMTPMRSMGRPLAPSPLQRPAATGRPGSGQYSPFGQSASYGQVGQSGQQGPFQRAHAPERFERLERGADRSHGEAAYTGELQRRYDRDHRLVSDARDLRDAHDSHDGRSVGMRHGAVRRTSQREMVRRRRANVLFVLVAFTGATLFLAATTKSSAMVYAFALAFVSLCGYCYKLAQLRQYEQDRPGVDASWYHAA
jgi:hypothetical protein